ncbi:hypothetical protein NE237_007975 [Protea cynaroides]|uniref:DUF4283 domain-containing protein n=1 Tax=Protea cynaroides TaxID=273540 RepID=A0A9Q0KQG3_9MAGN|nr:hypothetical protein NE237_007975 [Protea cynaroides]
MFIRSWDRSVHSGIFSLKDIPLWVSLPNLPLHLWGSEALSSVCLILGVSLYADETTVSKSRLAFARVFVQFNSASPLKDAILIEYDIGEMFIQPVKYDWKPPHCLDCYIFGHLKKDCPSPRAAPALLEDIPNVHIDHPPHADPGSDSQATQSIPQSGFQVGKLSGRRRSRLSRKQAARVAALISQARTDEAQPSAQSGTQKQSVGHTIEVSSVGSMLADAGGSQTLSSTLPRLGQSPSDAFIAISPGSIAVIPHLRIACSSAPSSVFTNSSSTVVNPIPTSPSLTNPSLETLSFALSASINCDAPPQSLILCSPNLFEVLSCPPLDAPPPNPLVIPLSSLPRGIENKISTPLVATSLTSSLAPLFVGPGTTYSPSFPGSAILVDQPRLPPLNLSRSSTGLPPLAPTELSLRPSISVRTKSSPHIVSMAAL